MLQVYERAYRLYVAHAQNKSNASELSQAANRLVLRLKFIVTVELLYDQAESDFVQCQTKMRAFAHRMCSEFKQIERI